jgi:hypothetical protein
VNEAHHVVGAAELLTEPERSGKMSLSPGSFQKEAIEMGSAESRVVL